MPTYNWVGKTRDGLSKKGVIVAEGVEAAMATLRAQAITPTTVKPKPKDLAEIFPFLQKGVKIRDLVIFTRQFATMIDAGLPLVQCLDILGTQQENPGFKKVIQQIKGDVESVREKRATATFCSSDPKMGDFRNSASRNARPLSVPYHRLRP